jgi:hypothetical protein
MEAMHAIDPAPPEPSAFVEQLPAVWAELFARATEAFGRIAQLYAMADATAASEWVLHGAAPGHDARFKLALEAVQGVL